jgi:deazaflavin-dependent oxidoreductase (nitroreductase family)
VRGATLSARPSKVRAAAKPLFGLRQQPGRLALAVFRLPLGLYRRGAGWLLARTFLVFTHVGRKTGTRYETAAMVLSYDRSTGEAVICSAWGPNTDWMRNLRATPAVEVRLGREAFVPEQRLLTDAAAFATGVAFRRRHPWRLRLLSWVLGWGDLRSDAAVSEFVRTHPFVSFRPPSRDNDAPPGRKTTT